MIIIVYRYNYLAKLLLLLRKMYGKILENILKFYDAPPKGYGYDPVSEMLYQFVQSNLQFTQTHRGSDLCWLLYNGHRDSEYLQGTDFFHTNCLQNNHLDILSLASVTVIGSGKRNK